MPNDLRPLLTPKELADRLRVSVSTVYRLVDARKLPFLKIGGQIRFDAKSIEGCLEDLTQKPIN